MKTLKTNWLLKHTLTVFSCVMIIVLGIAFLSHADPVTTTIGENIATNDLSVAGNITSGTWQGTAVGTQYGGTGADWSAVAQGNLPYFSAEGALSNLAPGTAGQFLKSQGTGADPEWANVTRSATFVVAANDSSALSKQQADYVCDGTDDQVEIQAAIDALPNQGGKIQLLEGNFYIGAPINLYRDIATWFNVWLDGMGLRATNISLQDNSNCNMIENIVLDNPSGWKNVSNMQLDGNKDNQSSGNCIYCRMSGTGSQYDMRFHNVFTARCKERGFHLNNVWGTYVTNCVTEYNGGDGFYLSGSESFIYGLHSSANGGTGAIIRGSEIHSSDLRIAQNQHHGLQVINSNNNTYSNIYIADWGLAATTAYYALQLTDTDDNLLYNNIFTGITIDGDNTSYSWLGINIHGKRNVFSNCSVMGITHRSVSFSSNGGYNILSSCQLEAGTDGTILNNGTNNIIRDNQGYTTESSGTATLANGTTSIVVTHGLDVTPSAGDITVTPIEAWGAMTEFYIDTYTSTQFTIHADQDPGQDVDFAWKAIVL